MSRPGKLALRLAYWANQFSVNKNYPWVGTGVIDDLKEAATKLGAPVFDTLYPPIFTSPEPKPDLTRILGPETEEDEFANFQPSPSEDYDL